MKEKISNYVTRDKDEKLRFVRVDVLGWNAFSAECACQDKLIIIFI